MRMMAGRGAAAAARIHGIVLAGRDGGGAADTETGGALPHRADPVAAGPVLLLAAGVRARARLQRVLDACPGLRAGGVDEAADLAAARALLLRRDYRAVLADPQSLREGRPPGPALTIVEDGCVERVSVSDVLYFRAVSKYTVARIPGGRHLCRTSLDTLARGPAHGFVRVHRAVLVAPGVIAGMVRVGDGWQLLLHGCSETLPVARRRVAALRALLVAAG